MPKLVLHSGVLPMGETVRVWRGHLDPLFGSPYFLCEAKTPLKNSLLKSDKGKTISFQSESLFAL